MSKTKAQLATEYAALEQKLAAIEAENEALRNRPARARFACGLWPNQERRTVRDPAWRGSLRFVVPPDKQPGDYVWIDSSLWDYDPETSPGTYKQNPPDFNLSVSPAPPDWEAELEDRRVKALHERGTI